MPKLSAAILLAILALGPQAIGTPIVVVGTRDGFVVGTNGLDSGGMEVCKVHYAGSTLVLRSTNDARWTSSRNPKTVIYDSTREEWKALDSHKTFLQISSAVRANFIESTKHFAELKSKNDHSSPMHSP